MWENNVNPLSLQQEPCPCTRPIRRAPLEKQEKTLNSQWLTALKTFGLLCQNSNTACGEDICAAASACSTSCIQPSCHMYVCVFSSCSVSVSASLSISSLQSHFGSVSERCSRRGSSSQHTAHYLAERTPSLWQMTDTVHIPESLSLFLLRAHQTRVDRLKRWPAGLVCWALGSSFFFFSLLTFQLSAPVSVATSGTSSRDQEVFSTALQSNGNDCAPGETEDCICVLVWSAVMRLRRQHAWKQNGCSPEYRFITMVPCGDSLFFFFLNWQTRRREFLIAKYSPVIQFESFL